MNGNTGHADVTERLEHALAKHEHATRTNDTNLNTRMFYYNQSKCHRTEMCGSSGTKCPLMSRVMALFCESMCRTYTPGAWNFLPT